MAAHKEKVLQKVLWYHTSQEARLQPIMPRCLQIMVSDLKRQATIKGLCWLHEPELMRQPRPETRDTYVWARVACIYIGRKRVLDTAFCDKIRASYAKSTEASTPLLAQGGSNASS